MSHADELGDFRQDRSAGKRGGVSSGGGGGSNIDPSYGDAMRILGRPWQMPPPYVERPLIMEDAEGEELARRLSALHASAGIETVYPNVAAFPNDPTWVGTEVSNFINTLMDTPPDRKQLLALRDAIQQRGKPEVQQALDDLCQFPAIAAILA